MSKEPISGFAAEYLRTWTEPDPQRRKEQIERLWKADGSLSVSSLGITIDGVDAIAAHIDGVHNDLIAGKGLQFVYDQEIQSGKATMLRWSMLAPDSTAVGQGADLVFRDAAGKITVVYMFMGVD